MRPSGLKMIAFTNYNVIINYYTSNNRIGVSIALSLIGKLKTSFHKFKVSLCPHSDESVIFDLWASIYKQ
jgi:hypothetical protein